MGIMSVSEAVEEAVVKSRKLKEGIIRGHWFEIVGNLSTKSEPLWIKEDTLYILVEDSVYLHHMSMNKNKYLKKIEEILKKVYVKDMRFKVSKVNKGEEYSVSLENKENKENFEKKEFISELKDLDLEKKIEILKRKSQEREEALRKEGYKKCNFCGTMFLGEGNLCKPCSLKESLDKVLEDKNDNE